MSKLLSLENIAYYDEILKEHIRRSNVSQNVATYDDLPKENLFDGMTVFVVNASGDDAVASGWAVYRYSLSDNSWVKVSEQESLDLALDWDDIENKPNLSFGNHSHGNIDSEGKIGNTANLPLITGANGAIIAGTFGNAANSFVEGDDSRLSDAREPINHASNKITSMENYEKAEEASSIATTDTLNDAIGKIEFKIDDFQCIDYEDIDVLFSSGQQQEEQIPPNTVRFVGVDPQTETVTIKNSNGTDVAYDGSGQITLEEGKTYSIVIDRKNSSSVNRFQVSFTADGESSLNIVNPVLYGIFKIDGPNADGMSVDLSNIGTQSNTSQTILSYVLNGRVRSDKSMAARVGTELIFVTDRKMLIKAIDLNTPGYDYTMGSWRLGLYGSDDGENWTRIAENSTVNEVFPKSKSLYNGIFVRIHFNDDSNPGYLYNKIRVEECSTYGDNRFYNMWLSEAYWAEDDEN